MASKQAKDKKPSNRVNSASKQEAASIAASVIGSQEGRKQKIVIWPEWSDADVNAEKWDAPHKPKEKEKGKSPSSLQHFFDDPEGRLDLPSVLRQRVDHWKRPHEFITDKTPVVYDPDCTRDIDLLTYNDHLDDCETLRWITSQITNLWHATAMPISEPHEGVTVAGGKMHPWRPWDHIYALCKVGKAPHLPLYNPHGKYIIRIYWMGTWRKVTVDDSVPFDDNGKMLLPCSRLAHELWPMLLTKALIKVFSLDYTTGNNSCEFGDVTVIQALTGWLPETIPLHHMMACALGRKLQALKEHQKSVTDALKSKLNLDQLDACPDLEETLPTFQQIEDGAENDSMTERQLEGDGGSDDEPETNKKLELVQERSDIFE